MKVALKIQCIVDTGCVWVPVDFVHIQQGYCQLSWWRHQMETSSTLLAIFAGNSPVPGEFPAQRPVTWSFDVFFDLYPNKRWSKQSWGWWFKTLSRPLWRHSNGFPGNMVKHCTDVTRASWRLKSPVTRLFVQVCVQSNINENNKTAHHYSVWGEYHQVAWSAPSHYLNQCLNIINWTLRNIFRWQFDRNSYVLIQENAFENVASAKWRPFVSASVCIYIHKKVGCNYSSMS